MLPSVCYTITGVGHIYIIANFKLHLWFSNFHCNYVSHTNTMCRESARFQLRLKNAAVPVSAAATAAATPAVTLGDHTGSLIATETQQHAQNASASSLDASTEHGNVTASMHTHQNDVHNASLPVAGASSSSSTSSPSPSSAAFSQSDIAEHFSIVAAQNAEKDSRTISSSKEELSSLSAAQTQPEYTESDVDACLSSVLVQNFDAVSSPAIITVAKYICNIASNPYERKFQSINMDNKVFKEKLAPAKGVLELLHTLGFRSEVPTHVVQSVFSAPNSTAATTSTTAAPNGMLHWTWSSVCPSAENLPRIVALLDKYMNELNIPASQRPQVSAPATKAQAAPHAAPAAPLVPFDPYKSHIVRNAPQPRGESSTSIELNALTKRRLELEGDKEAVQRYTKVLMPNSAGAVANIQDYLDEDTMADPEQDKQIRKALAKSIIGSMSGGGGGDDSLVSSDAPLKTKAMRDLEKAKKERVYNRVLIRVRFPDRVCLQGFFHPRHSMQDVYDWVRLSLGVVGKVPEPNGEEPTGDSGSDGAVVTYVRSVDELYGFELYTSPPRCVIARDGSSAGSSYSGNSAGAAGHKHKMQKSRSSEEEASTSTLTLADLQLVPATLLHLSWLEKTAVAQVLHRGVGVGGGRSISTTAVDAPSAGFYLNQNLMMDAEGKETAGNFGGGFTAASFPSGAVLSPGQAATGGADAAASKDGGEAAEKGSKSGATTLSSSSGNKGGKPKWFKLG